MYTYNGYLLPIFFNDKTIEFCLIRYNYYEFVGL